jgi:Domain of unknown function (DUF4234)
MAEEVQIQGSPEAAQAKIRSPLGVAVLSVVTLGIYVLFWWYYINREMMQFGRAKGSDEFGDSPGKSVLALFPGALVIVPAVMTLINTAKRTQAAARLAGRPEGINGWIALVLYLVISPAFFAYLQSDLNKTWEAQAAGAEALPADTTSTSEGTPQTTPQQAPPDTTGGTSGS